VAAKPSAHQFGPPATRVQDFDGLGQRNGPVFGNRRALFGLIQAGVLRELGGHSRRREQARKQDYRKKSEDRHGRELRRAPVNAG